LNLVFLIIQKNASMPDIKDCGFLSGDPCEAPCFFGIIPKNTKETQAVQILKDYGLYENCYIYDNESESGLRGAVCSNVSIAYFRDTDLVGSIAFRPTQHLTVEMVIEKFGEPDAVSVVSARFNWEKQSKTSMALVYNKINATINLGEQEENIFQLKPSTLIKSIGYSYHTFPLLTEYDSEVMFLSFWHGYGEYQDVSNP